MDEGHLSIEVLASKWLTDGKLSEKEFDQLSCILADFQKFYQRHIDIEDNVIFPLARRILDPSDFGAVGNEMMSRRGIKADKLKLP
jgi:hemerythrin-like domain-containing protein